MPEVSVIVPIYNAGKYLGRCIESIVNQTLKDIEIICINDGSTDNSLDIIRDFMERDKRIKLITQENSGYGFSMNRGIELASGEYIGIVEADDFVKDKMFEDLYELARKNSADIVKSDFYYYSCERSCGKAGKIKSSKGVFNIFDNPSILKIMPTIWTCIYRRDFLTENGIKFLETPGASYQDTSFAFKTLSLADRIVFTSKAYLHYRLDNEYSSIHSKEKVYAICGEYAEIDNFLDKNAKIKALCNTIKLIKQYKTYVWNIQRMDEKFRDGFIERFSAEFSDYQSRGEISGGFFRKINKKEYLTLIKDPKGYGKFIEKSVRQKSLKTQRRKIFSLRINSSRLSLVILGKTILEIGNG